MLDRICFCSYFPGDADIRPIRRRVPRSSGQGGAPTVDAPPLVERSLDQPQNEFIENHTENPDDNGVDDKAPELRGPGPQRVRFTALTSHMGYVLCKKPFSMRINCKTSLCIKDVTHITAEFVTL